ncbi:MAG: TlpA disulfide reductase family protein [Candidatus Nezhaarchaeales archaeon]
MEPLADGGFMRVSVWTIALLAIAIAAVAIAVASWLQLSAPKQPPAEAADFLLIDLQGRAFRLSDFRGRVVVLDFMATWCGPCRLQVPHLQEVRERYGDSVVVISISVDPVRDSEEVLRQFLEGYPRADWIWARDTINLKLTYGVVAIPTIIIVDQSGYVRFRHVGLTPSSTLIREIGEVLGRGSS